MSRSDAAGPLRDLTVLELGHFIAAPFATRLLADLGAEVIKIEPPGGDPVRRWGEQVNGASPWWSMHGRNKLSVVVDLKTARGREIVLGLAAQCDVVVENFRPGQLEKLGLGPGPLRAARPDLIIARVSGYGQDGPYRDKPAFGVIAEAMGGLRYLTNVSDPGDQPPVRVGVSIGDNIAGLYAAYGVLAALWRRDRGGGGATIDVALTESVLSMMDGVIPEYGALGKVRQPAGSKIGMAAPTNAYPTADGGFVLIAANSDPLFARLARLIGRPDLVDDEAYRDNPARVRNVDDLDAVIAGWTRQSDAVALLEALDEADIPSCRIYTAKDVAEDPQYRHRGMVREVDDPVQGRLLHTGVMPHIAEDPGHIRWCGPTVGQHTEAVLSERLGLSADAIAALHADGVV